MAVRHLVRLKIEAVILAQHKGEMGGVKIGDAAMIATNLRLDAIHMIWSITPSIEQGLVSQ